MKGMKRLGVVGGGAVVVAVLALASAAFACTNLAALNLSSSSGLPGTQITVTGSAFAKPPKNTPVELHWNGVNGPLLATITPDAAGAINPTNITIPADAKPGFYTIVATQTEIATGLNPWGIPARAGFTVQGPGATPVQTPAAAPVATSDSGVSGGFIALSVILGIGGLALFAFGAVTFLNTYRRRAPAVSRVRNS
jgi:hypothetical protein